MGGPKSKTKLGLRMGRLRDGDLADVSEEGLEPIEKLLISGAVRRGASDVGLDVGFDVVDIAVCNFCDSAMFCARWYVTCLVR